MQPTAAVALNKTMAVMVPSRRCGKGPRVGALSLACALDLEPRNAVALDVEEVVSGLLSLASALELAEATVKLVQRGVLGVTLLGHAGDENDKHEVVPSLCAALVPYMTHSRAHVSVLSILASLSVFGVGPYAVLLCQGCEVCQGGGSDSTDEGC